MIVACRNKLEIAQPQPQSNMSTHLKAIEEGKKVKRREDRQRRKHPIFK